MSESELQKALNTALARIAALESRQAPAAPAFDRDAFTADPMGAMKRMGLPVDHITRVVVANAMGDQAPPELRALAAMGPQVTAVQQLASQLQSLSQRLEQFETGAKTQAVRQSFSSVAADKQKYPLLAAAYARDPKLFDSDVEAHRGDAADLAANLEARLKALAPALGVTPSESTEHSETAQDQSTQAQLAQTQRGNSSVGTDPTPPPLPGEARRGTFSQADHEALKARVIQKFNAPQRTTMIR